MGIEAKRGCILTRQLDEVGTTRTALLADPGQIAGGILDANDTGQLGQLTHGRRCHVDDRAARNVVDHDRNIGAVVQGLKMRHHAALGRLIVIGRHHQRRICTDTRRKLDKTNRFDGIVGASARDDRHPACRRLDHLGDHGLVLFMAQRRAFACGANGHNTGRTLLDMPFYQVFERIQIQLAVAKRGDEGWHRAFEHGHAPLVANGRQAKRRRNSGLDRVLS